MVSKAELHQARKELSEAGASVVFQVETLAHLYWDYFVPKSPYTKEDVEIALLKELVSIWKNNTYNAQNIRNLLIKDDGTLTVILERAKNIKNKGKASDQIDLDNYTKYDRGLDLLRKREDEAQETEKELYQANEDKEKLQTDLTHSKENYGKLFDYWSANFSSEFDFKNLSVDGLGLVRERLNQLKADKEKTQKNYDELLIKIGKTSPETQQLENQFEIKVPLFLKDIPSELWDRTEVGNDWDRDYQVDRAEELPIMINHHSEKWDKRFKSDELLASFKKYTNGEDKFYLGRCSWGTPNIKDIANYNGNDNDDKNWYYTGDGGPQRLTQYLRDANKLFVKDGHGKTTSKEAFEFLKSIISSREITATIKLTGVNIEELQKQIQTLQDQLQQETSKASGLETELEDQQNTVFRLNENIDILDKENQDLKKNIEVLQKQLQQEKASSSLVVQEGEKLDWIKFLTLKDFSIHHADIKVYLKEDKKEIEQKEIYWDEVFDETEKEMKDQACSWLTNIVENVNNEVNDYGGKVKREKRGIYQARAHYFIFYKDGSKEHWLALLPQADSDKLTIELSEGHEHKTFILEFEKPVKKFVDVYTCLGCGASGQFNDLHSNYGYTPGTETTMPTDSWDKIHKVSFEPWYDELNNVREENGNIVSPSGRKLGGATHVWQGATINDPKDKTFDKAYGYVNKEGTLEWRLERTAQGIKENEEWALKEVSERIDSLWENKDFTSWKDKSPCQQRAMYSFIQDCLENEKDKFKLTLKYSGGEKTLEIKDLIEKIGDNFRELISAKKISDQFLERWIKRSLDGVNIREEVRNDEEFMALKDKPQVIHEIWYQQLEEFIHENKAKKFYSEKHREGLKWEHAWIDIGWLYKEVRDNLELENQVFEAHVEIPPKNQ